MQKTEADFLIQMCAIFALDLLMHLFLKRLQHLAFINTVSKYSITNSLSQNFSANGAELAC